MSYNESPNVYTMHPRPPGGAGEDIREREVPTSASRRAQQRQSGAFLRGPIPLRLIRATLDLPRRPLPLLLAICYRVDLTGKPWVTLPAGVMADFRFGAAVKARGLAELERAGLIRVQRAKGRPVLVALAKSRTGGGDAAGSAA